MVGNLRNNVSELTPIFCASMKFFFLNGFAFFDSYQILSIGDVAHHLYPLAPHSNNLFIIPAPARIPRDPSWIVPAPRGTTWSPHLERSAPGRSADMPGGKQASPAGTVSGRLLFSRRFGALGCQRIRRAAPHDSCGYQSNSQNYTNFIACFVCLFVIMTR